MEGKVGRRDTLTQASGQIDADNLRREEINGLAEHPGLGLDAAHTPPDHAEPVDHRGV